MTCTTLARTTDNNNNSHVNCVVSLIIGVSYSIDGGRILARRVGWLACVYVRDGLPCATDLLRSTPEYVTRDDMVWELHVSTGVVAHYLHYVLEGTSRVSDSDDPIFLLLS